MNLVSEVSIMRLRDVGFNIIIQAILGILLYSTEVGSTLLVSVYWYTE